MTITGFLPFQTFSVPNTRSFFSKPNAATTSLPSPQTQTQQTTKPAGNRWKWASQTLLQASNLQFRIRIWWHSPEESRGGVRMWIRAYDWLSCSWTLVIWVFPKMVVPPFHTPKWSFLVGKLIVVGYHRFRKHLFSIMIVGKMAILNAHDMLIKKSTCRLTYWELIVNILLSNCGIK